jgi:hypothetical protein
MAQGRLGPAEEVRERFIGIKKPRAAAARGASLAQLTQSGNLPEQGGRVAVDRPSSSVALRQHPTKQSRRRTSNGTRGNRRVSGEVRCFAVHAVALQVQDGVGWWLLTQVVR